nr:MAK10-like protein [Tanacetum cinerariifolium]
MSIALVLANFLGRFLVEEDALDHFSSDQEGVMIGDKNPIRTLGDYPKPSHEGYRNTIELPEGNNVAPLRSDTIRLVQNECSFHGLRSEDPNQHLKDFLKLVDSLNLDVANRERTPQLDPKQRVQVNKISSSCEIYSGPHETQYRMENPEQAFVEYASSRTCEAGDREFICTKDDGDVMFIEIIRKYDDSHEEGPEDEENTTIEGLEVEYFDAFSTRSELAYHKNEEDKRRGVEYVMSKILGFYKECLELEPKYLTGVAGEAFFIGFDSKSSSLGERDHDVIHKVVKVRDSIRMSGTNMLIEAGEKNSIGKCHNIALGHTLNPFSDVVC